MTQTSKEYAEALFALALETGNTDIFLKALANARSILDDQPEYIDFLACYAIPIKERTDALEQAFSDILPEYVLSFFKLLCENGSIKNYGECIDGYEKLCAEYKSESKATVTSVIELDDTQKSILQSKLEKICKRKTIIEYKIDKNIMGGLIIEADGKIIDGSVKGRLHEVKEVIDK